MAFYVEMVSSPFKMVACIGGCFFMPAVFLLGEAVKRLPAATVYATFVGVGTVGTAVVGMVFFHESTNLGRVFSLVLIVLGVIGLRLFSGTPE